ncbi:GGDEF domain-containing protein [Ruminococcus sp. HUN007]|uniref:GGDEF domain-containing protein n=1 Tax=Ruminococcus sp. HUN007 TaxID=1514668 RepID=UPI000A8C54EF|nr:GGDEF domain-containing protein [Ruminococcus sp. HUN007]
MNDTDKGKSLSFASLALALADDYTSLYVIDAEDDSYVEYVPSGENKELTIASSGKNFYDDVPGNAEKLVYKEDLANFLKTFSRDNVMKALAAGKSFTLGYRLVIDGVPCYYSLKTIRSYTDHSIIIGVQNVDRQMRHEKEMENEIRTFSDIATALAQQYVVIYHVNVLTNYYTEYSTSAKYSWVKHGTSGDSFFEECEENMKTSVYEGDRSMMYTALKKENLLNAIRIFGHVNLTYRLMIDDNPQYMALYAVRAAEDSDHIIIAVSNIDKIKRMELDYNNAVELVGKDTLTGVKSKHAYVEAEADLDRQIEKSCQPPFAIVICDVNGLKDINDSLGHKAGDEYIRRASTVICNAFSHSPVFRIGGDEFAVILKGRDYDCRSDLMEQMFSTLENSKTNGLVLFAAGISEFDPDMDLRVQDVFERSDKLMYENKIRCKSAAK